MKDTTKRLWFVASGPDSRHLVDVSVHNKLRDAKAVYATTNGRARQLFSLDFMPWQNGFNKRVLDEVLH